MSDLFWLSDAQMARLEPYFPKSHGKPRVDDRRVLSGIIFINRNGLRWRDGEGRAATGSRPTRTPHTAPTVEGDRGPSGAAKAPETLYNRWKRWR